MVCRSVYRSLYRTTGLVAMRAGASCGVKGGRKVTFGRGLAGSYLVTMKLLVQTGIGGLGESACHSSSVMRWFIGFVNS